jgi:hypothetical protein
LLVIKNCANKWKWKLTTKKEKKACIIRNEYRKINGGMKNEYEKMRME